MNIFHKLFSRKKTKIKLSTEELILLREIADRIKSITTSKEVNVPEFKPGDTIKIVRPKRFSIDTPTE